MKFQSTRLILLIFFVIAITSFLYADSSIDIEGIISDFRAGDHEAIISRIAFPIKRQYPLSLISSEKYVREHFEEIFDQNIIHKVSTSNIKVDWQEVGWRGFCLGNGDIWVNSNGKIYAINYQTEIEKSEWQKLVNSERRNLPESLQVFDMPISFWKTSTYVVRVDDINHKARLILWKRANLEKPFLVLLNGKMSEYGTIGTYNLDWILDDKVYRVQENLETIDELPQFQIFRAQDLEINVEAEPIFSEDKEKE